MSQPNVDVAEIVSLVGEKEIMIMMLNKRIRTLESEIEKLKGDPK